jgi:3-dehydroquinate dehydratase II
MANILVIHGPNLNLLGSREADIYGTTCLETINQSLGKLAASLGHQISCHQSNAEHTLVEYIQQAKIEHIDFIIINPAAYTHTSVALRDAFLAVDIPFVEVHLSNIKARESFRHESYLADIATGGIFGFGAYSYELALNAANHYLKNKEI